MFVFFLPLSTPFCLFSPFTQPTFCSFPQSYIFWTQKKIQKNWFSDPR